MKTIKLLNEVNRVFLFLLMLLCLNMFSSCSKPNIIKSAITANLSKKSLTATLNMNDSYVIENRSNDLWVTYKSNDTSIYDFRIGGAGAISELRWSAASNEPLLSPPYATEHTDRVIQTTWWSNTIVDNNTSEPEKRWNVTQAGDGAGTFSPTDTVLVNQSNHSVDVYSYPQDQFTPDYDATLHGGFKMLTRYTGLANGVIEVRRVMIATQPDSSGVSKSHQSLYIEGWTPFLSATNTFNALALSLDTTGTPNWWYLANYNIPTYQNLDVTSTNGYAVVYNTSSSTSNVYAAWVFGNQQVNNKFSGFYALNTLNWNNGIGVLPGLNFTDFPVSGIIDQTFYLYVGKNMNAATRTFLNSLVSSLPAVVTYGPTDTLPTDLSTIVSSINSYTSASGTRTEHLATIASGL